MNPAVLVFPAAVAGGVLSLAPVALVSSRRGIRRTEAAVRAERELTERRHAEIRHGVDIARVSPHTLTLAQLCAQTLHSRLAFDRVDRADHAAITWACQICASLGTASSPALKPLGLGRNLEPGDDPTPTIDPAAPILTVTACLITALFRLRRDLYAAGRPSEGHGKGTEPVCFIEHLLYAVPGGGLLRPLILDGRVRSHARQYGPTADTTTTGTGVTR